MFDMCYIVVNGVVGVVFYCDGRLFSIGGVTVWGGRIVVIDIFVDFVWLDVFFFG